MIKVIPTGKYLDNTRLAMFMTSGNILNITRAEAINIINRALSNNPFYLEWLKIQKWDGILPLVTGGDGATPFIEIPTERP